MQVSRNHVTYMCDCCGGKVEGVEIPYPTTWHKIKAVQANLEAHHNDDDIGGPPSLGAPVGPQRYHPKHYDMCGVCMKKTFPMS